MYECLCFDYRKLTMGLQYECLMGKEVTNRGHYRKGFLCSYLGTVVFFFFETSQYFLVLPWLGVGGI